MFQVLRDFGRALLPQIQPPKQSSLDFGNAVSSALLTQLLTDHSTVDYPHVAARVPHLLSALQSNTETPILVGNSLEQLDRWAKHQQPSKSILLASIFHSIEPGILEQKFGRDVIFWAECTNPCKASLLEHLNSNGVNPKLFEISRVALWRLHEHDRNSSAIKSTYDLLKNHIEGKLPDIALADLLLRHEKQNVTMSVERIRSYSLKPIHVDLKIANSSGPADRNFDTLPDKLVKKGAKFVPYLDSPLAIVLQFEGVPQAILGFYACSSHELRVNQIQGVKLNLYNEEGELTKKLGARGLATINFQELMIDVAEQYAAAHGFTKVSIQSGKNCKWTWERHDDGRIHMPFIDAHKMYDRTASACGYKRVRGGNWMKQVC